MPDTPGNLPLPQTHCADCGYSLNGLPTAGNCPECGTPYDDQTLILFGWPTLYARLDSRFLLLRNITLGVAVFLLICAVVRLFDALMGVNVNPPVRVLQGVLLTAVAYAVPAVVLIFVARIFHRLCTRDFADPSRLGTPSFQLRLSQRGYSFRDGFGPAHMFHGWHPTVKVYLSRTGSLAHLSITTPVSALTPIQFSFPATAEQVTALKSYIADLRTKAKQQ